MLYLHLWLGCCRSRGRITYIMVSTFLATIKLKKTRANGTLRATRDPETINILGMAPKEPGRDGAFAHGPCVHP